MVFKYLRLWAAKLLFSNLTFTEAWKAGPAPGGRDNWKIAWNRDSKTKMWICKWRRVFSSSDKSRYCGVFTSLLEITTSSTKALLDKKRSVSFCLKHTSRWPESMGRKCRVDLALWPAIKWFCTALMSWPPSVCNCGRDDQLCSGDIIGQPPLLSFSSNLRCISIVMELTGEGL